MFINLHRILKTTLVDIKRNKYISLSSIFVMALVFLVFSIFSLFAYAATKMLNYLETREHLEVFFNTDVAESKILEVKGTLEQTGKTAYVTYTTQEEAAEFLRQRHSDNPLILGAITPEALPASLAVRAKKIDYVPELRDILKMQDPDNTLIYKISYNEDTTNLLKDLLLWVRLVGGFLFAFLIVVIFLVSLITVEIGVSLRKEEIGIMRLVGGSKVFIRMPFILEGIIYGVVGATIAAIILAGFGIAFHFVKDQSPTLSFISQFFSDLSLPRINPVNIGLLFVLEIVAGGVVGGLNSLLAVIRHLK